MTKYMFKTMDMISSWLPKLTRKNSYLNNYLIGKKKSAKQFVTFYQRIFLPGYLKTLIEFKKTLISYLNHSLFC